MNGDHAAQHGRIAESSFRPAPWLPGPHLQTLWPFLARRNPIPELDWERLELPDGDFLDLAWSGNGRNICIILHGLEGSYRSHYAPALIETLSASGWCVAFMHFRGCGGDINRLPRSYHSGETGDLRHVIRLLRIRHQPASMVATGFSLGGNVLLKYLGESGTDAGLDAAVAISVPFDLAAGAAKLERGLSRLYQWWLVRALQQKIRTKFGKLASPIPLDNLENLNTFRRFDHAVTAPLHGFRDADDYYRHSSSRRYLYHIRVPALLLQAADDPFLPESAIPDAPELSPSVRLELSSTGGHVGFVGGRYPWRPIYWLEHRIPEFLSGFIR